MNSRLAYHYTTGQNFQPIINSGYLRPADAYIEDGEKPILWFSLSSYWERTANKAFHDQRTGQTRTLTMQETFEKGGGLVRFGYPVSELLPWKTGELRKQAGMSKSVSRSLSREGKRQGANPNLWFGCFSRKEISELQIQIMNKDDDYQWSDPIEGH